MKGIVLAAGRGKRLHPITKVVSKPLLPVYNKPMIYYPLSVLMLAGIKDILLISNQESLPLFETLLGDGSDLGVSVQYGVQKEPKGIAEAFLIGEKFLGDDRVCLIFGDNIFYGYSLNEKLTQAMTSGEGATIFGYCVSDPSRYGVVEFDKNFNVLSIEEKPKVPKSNYAVTGLYFYDNEVVKIAKSLKPSGRGELEITDVNKAYLAKGKLKMTMLDRGFAWFDTGTFESIVDATTFIKAIEERQGLKVGCLEEVAYRMGYINNAQLEKLAAGTDQQYRDYLLRLLK